MTMLESPVVGSPLGAGFVSALSNEELATRLDGLFRQRAAVDGAIVELLGEVDRRESYPGRGGDVGGALARRALRCLPADGAGVRPRRPAGLGSPAPG